MPRTKTVNNINDKTVEKAKTILRRNAIKTLGRVQRLKDPKDLLARGFGPKMKASDITSLLKRLRDQNFIMRVSGLQNVWQLKTH